MDCGKNRKEILLVVEFNSLTYQYQEHLSVQPEIGCLTQRAGLDRFQQTDYRYTAKLYETRTFKEMETEEALEEWRRVRPDAEFSWSVSMVYSGELEDSEEDLICPHCGAPIVTKGYEEVTRKHAASGRYRAEVVVRRYRFRCPHCGRQSSAEIPFQAAGHRITVQLEQDIEWFCRLGLSLMEIERITGVHRHIIRDIDKVLRGFTGMVTACVDWGNRQGFFGSTCSVCIKGAAMLLRSWTWRPGMFCSLRRARRRTSYTSSLTTSDCTGWLE